MKVFLLGFGKGVAIGLIILVSTAYFQIHMELSHWFLIFVGMFLSDLLNSLTPSK